MKYTMLDGCYVCPCILGNGCLLSKKDIFFELNTRSLEIFFTCYVSAYAFSYMGLYRRLGYKIRPFVKKYRPKHVERGVFTSGEYYGLLYYGSQEIIFYR